MCCLFSSQYLAWHNTDPIHPIIASIPRELVGTPSLVILVLNHVCGPEKHYWCVCSILFLSSSSFFVALPQPYLTRLLAQPYLTRLPAQPYLTQPSLHCPSFHHQPWDPVTSLSLCHYPYYTHTPLTFSRSTTRSVSVAPRATSIWFLETRTVSTKESCFARVTWISSTTRKWIHLVS